MLPDSQLEVSFLRPAEGSIIDMALLASGNVTSFQGFKVKGFKQENLFHTAVVGRVQNTRSVGNYGAITVSNFSM